MTDISNWIPSLGTAALLTVILYLCRDLILAGATRAIQHRFDTKLEEIRTELHRKEAQISALREVALASFANRRAALDKRRLEAVEKIWAAVVSLGQLKLASTFMASINFEVATKEVSKNPQARKLFEIFGKSVDFSKIKTSEAENERPFVSPTAWALFSAYRAILMYAGMQMTTLEQGLDASKFLTNKKIDALIKAAMPHYSDYIEEYGSSGYNYLLDDFEQKLLDELKKILDGAESDAADLAAATKILRATEQLDVEINANTQTKSANA